MKGLLVVILVLVVAVVGLAYWQGWFSVAKEDGKPKITLNREKFKEDLAAFKKDASAK